MIHIMNATEVVSALEGIPGLQSTPRLIRDYGIQFQDGHRLISIPPFFAGRVADAVEDALKCMNSNPEIMAPGIWEKAPPPSSTPTTLSC
jgi:hypothetical protein